MLRETKFKALLLAHVARQSFRTAHHTSLRDATTNHVPHRIRLRIAAIDRSGSCLQTDFLRCYGETLRARKNGLNRIKSASFVAKDIAFGWRNVQRVFCDSFGLEIFVKKEEK